MSTMTDEIKDMLKEISDLEYDGDAELIEGEDIQSSREFLLDFFSEIMEGDQDDEVEGTETEVDSTAVEAREMDEVVANIVDERQELQYSAWTEGMVLNDGYQTDDDDGRKLTAEDIHNGTELLNRLEREVMGLPSVEDRKALLRIIKTGQAIMEEQRSAYRRLDDIADSIVEVHGVSKDTHQHLTSLGLGVESYLPDAAYYTQATSTVNYTATLEAIDAKKGALAAIAALAACGIIYKIVSWIHAKITKKVKPTVDNAMDVTDNTEKQKQANSNADQPKVPVEELKGDEYYAKILDQFDGNAITATNIRSIVGSKKLSEAGDKVQAYFADPKQREAAKHHLVEIRDALARLTEAAENQLERVKRLSDKAERDIKPENRDKERGWLNRLVDTFKVKETAETRMEVNIDDLNRHANELLKVIDETYDASLDTSVARIQKEIGVITKRLKPNVQKFSPEHQSVLNNELDYLSEISKQIAAGSQALANYVKKGTTGARAAAHAEQEVTKFIEKYNASRDEMKAKAKANWVEQQNL